MAEQIPEREPSNLVETSSDSDTQSDRSVMDEADRPVLISLQEKAKRPRPPDWSLFVPGYPRLAAYMMQCPERAIFRRFDNLNGRDILYQQDELIRLEKELEEQERLDFRESLRFRADEKESPFRGRERRDLRSDKQRELFETIREKLMAEVQKLSKPRKYEGDYVWEFIRGAHSDMTDVLDEIDFSTWGFCLAHDSCAHPDTMALRSPPDKDAAASFVPENGLGLYTAFYNMIGRFFKTQTVVGYYESDFVKYMYWVSSLMAALLPVAATFVLAAAESNMDQLKSVAAFNALAALCLGIFTRANTTEVFLLVAVFTTFQVMIMAGEILIQ
ncbi:hypothetical protein BU23DRAFT_629000 [Bimuria novae-zelandiae CBS 107.79]|uniref:DUF6594 domain-containing protein n=1 Tax=Bimuria novae-zelandiae CBS 107.79 TaxID=1447943 RepID=A0A6A5UK79_9PLEO|nr:hypothetical protein BU23DRAFT_629000 [Bimuria novae-zelandiae CBS 107.79]